MQSGSAGNLAGMHRRLVEMPRGTAATPGSRLAAPSHSAPGVPAASRILAKSAARIIRPHAERTTRTPSHQTRTKHLHTPLNNAAVVASPRVSIRDVTSRAQHFRACKKQSETNCCFGASVLPPNDPSLLLFSAQARSACSAPQPRASPARSARAPRGSDPGHKLGKRAIVDPVGPSGVAQTKERKRLSCWTERPVE